MPSTFDSLRPASFRGVPFEVDGHDESGGRRLARHEYPLRDIPYTEDLGRKAGEWRIEAFFVYRKDVDVPAKRDALRDALRASGPGTLIHPWLGELEVCVESYTCRESTREGGYVQFSISFVEAGQMANPQSFADTAAGVNLAASGTQDELARHFAEIAQYLEAEDISQVLQRHIATVSSLLAWPAQVAAQGAAVVRECIEAPEQLAQVLCSLFQQSRERSVQGSPSGVDMPSVLHNVLPTAQSSSPEQAAGLLVGGATLIDRCRQSAATVYQTADDALADRTELSEAVDMLAAVCPDALYGPLLNLRTAVVADLGARGAVLPRIRRVRLPGTIPALVAAYRIHGTALREADIITRNRVRHPGKVPGGADIEVIV